MSTAAFVRLLPLAWNEWSRVNEMVDQADRTRHEMAAVARFALQTASHCLGSNAVVVRIIQVKTRPDLSDIKVLSIDCQ